MRLTKLVLLFATFFISLSVVLATPVNVKNFGAQGNGSTDDRIAIQNAIDSIPLGGTVYFPTGLYNTSGTIYVPSNIRIQGMSSYYDSQLRLTATDTALFEVEDGSAEIIFKDITLIGWSRQVWPRHTTQEVDLIRQEGTVGISLRAGDNSIKNVTIENVRILQMTQGIAATATTSSLDASISYIKIRNYLSDGNEYALYTNTYGADFWDVQNMNAFPMYDQQNGIFLERSGEMSFLQLSCAGLNNNGICAKMWDNGKTYFRQMHVEGPRLGFCVGSTNCDGSSTTTGANSSQITIENSATDGEFHRATNLVSINNRFWLDLGLLASEAYEFVGTGANSWLMSCNDVWVKHDPATHMTDTTVTAPPGAFPGLTTSVNGCLDSYLSSVPVFGTGYTSDNERLDGEIDVTVFPFSAVPDDGVDDTIAFQDALIAIRAVGGSKRLFVPTGVFEINDTLQLYDGETVLGEAGSVIELTNTNKPLFKVLNNPTTVRGITWRNITLQANSLIGTTGISLENFDKDVVGAASDFIIQNVNFQGFQTGIRVQPFNGNPINAFPMYDSVSVKSVGFYGNTTAMLIRSSNASNWNLEKIEIDIPTGGDGIWSDRTGNLSIRSLSCSGDPSGSSCVTIQRQGGTYIYDLDAHNVTNTLVVRWENGWTQFPVTVRNSSLLEGVYFQGRAYLNSVANVYPAHLGGTSPKIVEFGAYGDGDPWNVAYGGLSDVFSCGDTFLNVNTSTQQSTWEYSGVLSPPITYCQP